MIVPADFRLVAACCIWPPSEKRIAAVRAAADGFSDWDGFLRSVTRHRVSALVRDGLERAGIAVPDAVRDELARNSAIIARLALGLAQEALTLQEAFERAGIPAAFLKGSALAILAYGNLGIKHAWDIDLLVQPEDLRRVNAMLAELGYQRYMPPASLPEERFYAWTEIARESMARHATRDIYLELHWRLCDNPAMLAHVTARSCTRQVEIAPGRSLRTLDDQDLFVYLCAHGAHHAWSRLKWLGDLAALIAPKSTVEVEALYRRAQGEGAGRCAAQALLLCEQLFALELAPCLSRELRSDRATRWLVSIALNEMAGDAQSRQTDDRVLGNLRIELSHLLLASDVKAWFHELRSKSIGWTDFQTIALPRRLYFLYPVLRVPSWLWRRVAHLAGYRRQIVD